jgi:hypothetical protein
MRGRQERERASPFKGEFADGCAAVIFVSGF